MLHTGPPSPAPIQLASPLLGLGARGGPPLLGVMSSARPAPLLPGKTPLGSTPRINAAQSARRAIPGPSCHSSSRNPHRPRARVTDRKDGCLDSARLTLPLINLE